MAQHFKCVDNGAIVPFTADEEAQYLLDQAADVAAATVQAGHDANAQTMRQSLVAAMQQMVDLAALFQAGTATAADQRTALALCLRSSVRLTRLMLELFDQAT
jgi:hypothetical protein